MKTEVIDVLLYIFEHFQDNEYIPIEKAKTLVDQLEDVGFKSYEISSALGWLDGLVNASSRQAPQTLANLSTTRIFHPYEQHYLSIESQGFIYFLEQSGVLDTHSREMVVEQVLALDSENPIDLEQLKWVIMMVLFNLPGKEAAAVWLENMDARLH